jgi:hypothetical protein
VAVRKGKPVDGLSQERHLGSGRQQAAHGHARLSN